METGRRWIQITCSKWVNPPWLNDTMFLFGSLRLSAPQGGGSTCEVFRQWYLFHGEAAPLWVVLRAPVNRSQRSDIWGAFNDAFNSTGSRCKWVLMKRHSDNTRKSFYFKWLMFEENIHVRWAAQLWYQRMLPWIMFDLNMQLWFPCLLR